MSERAEVPATKSCPICGKPADAKVRPFCSRRCADVDLNRWLSGVYAVPVEAEEDEDGTAVEEGGGEARPPRARRLKPGRPGHPQTHPLYRPRRLRPPFRRAQAGAAPR